jgi:ribonuclease P protein subunit POP4
MCHSRATRKLTTLYMVDSYEAVRPLYQLWLGYAAELLALPLRSATPVSPPAVHPASSAGGSSASSSLLSTYPARVDAGGKNRETQFNVINLQTKLIKAEFVGCMLSGALTFPLQSFTMSC